MSPGVKRLAITKTVFHEAFTLRREILSSRRSTPSFVPHGGRCPNLSSAGLIADQSGRRLPDTSSSRAPSQRELVLDVPSFMAG